MVSLLRHAEHTDIALFMCGLQVLRLASRCIVRERIREIQLWAIRPQLVSDRKWFMLLLAGGEEELWQSALSAITVARLRGNGNINSSFCNACKWLNEIILIIIISMVVGLPFVSLERLINMLYQTHTRSACLRFFFAVLARAFYHWITHLSSAAPVNWC